MNEELYTLADLTFEEAKARIARGAYALVPCGATEAHGPHLALSTDVVIAQGGARRAARSLAHAGVTALVLPALAYSVAEYAAGFDGTLSIGKDTARMLVRDVVHAAMRTGFRGVVLCNAHLEPANIEAITLGAQDAREKGAKVSFPDVTKKPHALRLGEEFKSGACHAGHYETSLVLAEDPFLVRGEIAYALPANAVSLSRAIRDGKATFEEAGGPRAYFGTPATASAPDGEALYTELADIFAGGVRELMSARAD